VAFSAAEANSAGLGPSQNEMQVALHTDAPGINSSGRGAALQLDVGGSLPEDQQAITLAEQANSTSPSDPPTDLVRHELPGIPNNPGDGPLALNPLAWASLLRGEADSNFDNNPCQLGPLNPLGYGLGYAADVQLLDTTGSTTGMPDGRLIAPVIATDNPFPERSVTQSRSVTYAVPNGTGNYGLVSQTRMTFAPIHIGRFNPLPAPFGPGGLVVELLGEWTFTATATGLPGGSSLTFDVRDASGNVVSDDTPIIRISTNGGLTYTNVLSFQDFDPLIPADTGLVLPPDLNPLISLAVSEDPRAIAAPGALPDPESSPTVAGDGTMAAGAVDVVRLALLHTTIPGGSLADLRIGHFEASAAVPAGGFDCTDPTTTTSTTVAPTTSTIPGTTTTTTTPATTTTTIDDNPGGTTTTTTPQPGILEICNEADNSHGTVSGNFTYKFNNRTVTVPADGCTGPLSVTSRQLTVHQSPRAGIRMTDCDTTPAFRLVNCQPENLQATTKTAAGGVEKETILTFTNVVDDNNQGSIKVCKIAGNGVAVGTPFNFTVGNRPVTVQAGPANQGGYCKLLTDFALGSNQTITEAAKAGTHVSAIVVQPSANKVSSNLANRTATVKVSRNTTVVNFTNTAN
jgi:hypothetical protein